MLTRLWCNRAMGTLGRGELTHSVVLIQKPPQPGPTSGTASPGAQLGGPHASASPLARQCHPSFPSSVPSLAQSHLLPPCKGRAGRCPDPGAPLGFPPPCPCSRSRGRVTSARGPSTMLRRPRCSSPHLRPGRGKEARDTLPPAQPQLLMATPPPAPALRSPSASPLGWGGSVPTSQCPTRRHWVRYWGSWGRVKTPCKHLCTAPTAGSSRVLRGAEESSISAAPVQPIPSPGQGSLPKSGVSSTPTSLTSRKRSSSIS